MSNNYSDILNRLTERITEEELFKRVFYALSERDTKRYLRYVEIELDCEEEEMRELEECLYGY